MKVKVAMWNSRRFTTALFATSLSVFSCQGSLDGQAKRPGQGPGTTPSATPSTVPDFTMMNPGTGNSPPALSQLQDEPVVMHRLTGTEYDNTVRDLVGTNLNLARTFPSKEVARGFDNNAFTLTFPAQLAESAYTASQQVAKRISSNLATFVPCASTPDQACARQFITSFGQEALRRPLAADEIEKLVAVFDIGNRRTFARGIELVVSSLTISAPFWYRMEFGDGQAVPSKPDMMRPTSFEMATRLSYLAWNSTPDSGLLSAAQQDELKTPEQIQAAFARLLTDPRAHEAVANFNDQWLQISRVAAVNKDPMLFPTWKSAMGEAMGKELAMFSEQIAWNSARGFEDLFTSSASFANADLAAFYGATGATGATDTDFTAVTLDSAKRAGFFARAGFLALEGFNQTSPVRRAAFIRRRLLCQDPPPPPPNVKNTPIPPSASNTTKDRAIAHSSNPACQGCHALLDPVGFGLENYDAIGAYRSTENGLAVDGVGTILQSDIGDFKGAVELGQKFSVSVQAQECMAQQLYRFAYGRSPSEQRYASVTRLASVIKATGGNYPELLRTLVTLDEFLYRPKTPS